MVGKSETAASCDHRVQCDISKLLVGILKQRGKSFPDIGIVAFVVGKENMMCIIQDGNFYRSGTDVNSQCIMLVIHEITAFLLIAL